MVRQAHHEREWACRARNTPFVLSVAQRSRSMNGNPREPRTTRTLVHRSIPDHGSTGSPRTGRDPAHAKNAVRPERSAAKSKDERQPARTTHPLGLSPPKHSRSWFDRLTTNANGPGAREKPPFVLSVAQRSRRMNGNPREPRTTRTLVHRSVPDHGSTGSPRTRMKLSHAKELRSC